jgi:hypothetical protein
MINFKTIGTYFKTMKVYLFSFIVAVFSFLPYGVWVKIVRELPDERDLLISLIIAFSSGILTNLIIHLKYFKK